MASAGHLHTKGRTLQALAPSQTRLITIYLTKSLIVKRQGNVNIIGTYAIDVSNPAHGIRSRS